MYVGPWQEYRALARARHAEALYATRGPETQVADELERLRRALELVSGELPADKAAKVREALAPVAEPGPPPLPGLSWNPRAAPRRPAPVVRPVKPPPHVLTSLRLDDVRGGAATFLLGTRAPSTDPSRLRPPGKNASAHSAQALGLADFKNAFSTPLSSRGGPAARPLSARSARSQASSEHRTSRSNDRRPREGHATARPPTRVARRRRLGSDAAKDVARVQGCRRAPAKTVRAGTAAATGAAADARGAIGVRSRQNRAVPTSGAPWATDPSCLPYVVRGAARGRARARAAGDRRGATAAANGDAGRARARPGRGLRRAYLESARRGDDGPRRPSVPLPMVAAPAESAPAPGGAVAKFDLTAAQMGAVAKYFGDESTPPPPVATVAPDTPAETVDDLLNWAEGLEARERAMSPPPRLSPRRRRGDEWL